MADGSDGKNRIGIILAVVAGLLALGMMFIFLKRMKDAAAPQPEGPAVQTESILISRSDLPCGHVIKVNTDFQSIDVPRTDDTEAFIRACVAADTASELEGRKIGTAIPARYPLFYGNLLESFSLDEEFTEGYLKTITVGKENLFAGQLIPGDHVDILVTMPVANEKSEKSGTPEPAGAATEHEAMLSALMQAFPTVNPQAFRMETYTVLQNVEVFMVGPLLKMDRVQLGFMPPNQTSGGAELTFRLNRQDAITLTKYCSGANAKISLLLRPRKPHTEPGE